MMFERGKSWEPSTVIGTDFSLGMAETWRTENDV